MAEKLAHDRINVVRLPHLDHDTVAADLEARLIQRYREFRLHALRNDPDVFASSYDEEVRQPSEYWRKRLANPSAVNIVAVYVDKGESVTTIDELLTNEWAGTIVLLGPMVENGTDVSAAESPWTKVPSVMFNTSLKDESKTQSLNAIDATLTFHISGAYTATNYRMQGVGKTLLQTALDTAHELCKRRGIRHVKTGVHVDTFNDAARGLYEKYGFKIIDEQVYPPRVDEEGRGAERRAYLMQSMQSVV